MRASIIVSAVTAVLVGFGGALAPAMAEPKERFASAVDGRPNPPDILREETIELMVSCPGFTRREGKLNYCAMGWHIHPMESGDIW